ncbi:LysR family transcriptional regulator [Clostridium sp. MSJ-11]|uniref:LysR family transcriptional regulator n=1 Tax=Clostridium mobile TaxID=2841512 RepID=A0ABS6EH30_9CLOT|nr:LysR family transcriptional regulator [Clostridium mobile]MBU5484516.1 LysR family transcriptional regulator [Clostridium mobile]
MKVEYLKYVIEVERQGSISKAARSLFLTQPHLSKTIRELEEELNITIFVRDNNGVQITDQGKEFLEHAKKIIKDLENFIKLYKDTQSKSYNFKLSTIYSSHIVETFFRLNKEYKDETNTQFYIKETDNYTVINDIYSQESNVGVIYVPKSMKNTFINTLKMKNIDYKFICDLGKQVILSKNHPLLKNGHKIQSKDLYKYGMVRYADFMGFGIESVDYLSAYNLKGMDKITKIIYVHNRATLHNVLTQTDYFTIGMIDAINQEEMHNITSATIEDDDEFQSVWGEMWAINLKDKTMDELSKKFIKILKNNYGKMKKQDIP